MMERQDSRVAVVLGVGPGLGSSVARRFARGDFAVGLMARGAEALSQVEQEIRAVGGQAVAVPTDAADPADLAEGFARVRTELGSPEVLVYNAATLAPGGILELAPEELARSWQVNCLGAFLSVREVLPAMLERRHGTILLTGAPVSLHGSDRLLALAVGKFGLRALAQSLARELGPRGIHVAHVVVNGAIDGERTRAFFPHLEPNQMLAPEAVADLYWQLAAQPARAWTLEADLAPAVNPF